MQALLPSPSIPAKEEKSPDSSAAQSNNSKAAKVESAIEYIRELQKLCQDKDRLIDQKDLEMEALRKELAALKRDGSTCSNSRESEAEEQLKAESNSSPAMENVT
jgi:hypothetical protein